ncbi:hypothetical protein Tco_0515441 [Tanacetum coccineum]
MPAKRELDNVEMLMQGISRTIQQMKEDLVDDSNAFVYWKTNQFHDYFCAIPQACTRGQEGDRFTTAKEKDMLIDM